MLMQFERKRASRVIARSKVVCDLIPLWSQWWRAWVWRIFPDRTALEVELRFSNTSTKRLFPTDLDHIEGLAVGVV